MSFRDLFDRRDEIAQEFRNGAKIDDIVKRHGGDWNAVKKIILLKIPRDEYDRIRKDRHDAKYA